MGPAPQIGHVSGFGAWMDWKRSKTWPFGQRYSYVGIKAG